MPLGPGRRILLRGGDPNRARAADKHFLRTHAAKSEDPLAEKVSAEIKAEREARNVEGFNARLDKQIEDDRFALQNDIMEKESMKEPEVVRARRQTLERWERWCADITTHPERTRSLDIPTSALIWLGAHEEAVNGAHRVHAIKLPIHDSRELRLLIIENYFRNSIDGWDLNDNRICRSIVGKGGINLANELIQNRELLQTDRIMQLMEFRAPIGARPEAGVLLLENYRQRDDMKSSTRDLSIEHMRHFARSGFSWLLIHDRNHELITERVQDVSPKLREYLGLTSTLYDKFGIVSLTETSVD